MQGGRNAASLPKKRPTRSGKKQSENHYEKHGESVPNFTQLLKVVLFEPCTPLLPHRNSLQPPEVDGKARRPVLAVMPPFQWNEYCVTVAQRRLATLRRSEPRELAEIWRSDVDVRHVSLHALPCVEMLRLVRREEKHVLDTYHRDEKVVVGVPVTI